jgi:hypothetical protein
MPVTEAEWLVCAEPMAMLEYLRGIATSRRLRLFAVELCRQLWPLLSDKSYCGTLEVAERFADGHASPMELAAAFAIASQVAERGENGSMPGPL